LKEREEKRVTDLPVGGKGRGKNRACLNAQCRKKHSRGKAVQKRERLLNKLQRGGEGVCSEELSEKRGMLKDSQRGGRGILRECERRGKRSLLYIWRGGGEKYYLLVLTD